MKITFIKYATIFLLLVVSLAGCENLEDTYSDYRGDGPERYLSAIYDLKGNPQWKSVLLTWNLKPDPGRTAIMVKWTKDKQSDSVLIDKESTSYLVEELINYEYEFSVNAVEEVDGKVTKRSLGDPVNVCPYTNESEEVMLFGRMVNKQFNVADKQLFVSFDEWVDGLIELKIGYFEKGDATEKFWSCKSDEVENRLPKGKLCGLIGEDIDFSKEIKVYRKGVIKEFGDMELDLEPVVLYFDLPVFESDFAQEVRQALDLNGEIKWGDIENVTALHINYDQVSLVDVLLFKNLKEIYLGRERYLATGTEDEVRSTLEPTKVELSIEALRVAAEELGVKIYHYGKHYFDEVPDFFILKNAHSEVPALDLLNTADWDITVEPGDALGFDSGLKNLLKDDNSYWLPQPKILLREHVIEIDMKQERSISGFKIVQAPDFGDKNIYRPGEVKIEVETAPGLGVWEPVTFHEKKTLGAGKGETTIVYLNKDKGVKNAQKVRFKISDNFYKNQWNYDLNTYSNYYNVVLSTIMVINGN